jgi:hypothetical protein
MSSDDLVCLVNAINGETVDTFRVGDLCYIWLHVCLSVFMPLLKSTLPSTVKVYESQVISFWLFKMPHNLAGTMTQ